MSSINNIPLNCLLSQGTFFFCSYIYITRASQKFCNICICASFQNKPQELEGTELIPYLIYSLDQAPWDY